MWYIILCFSILYFVFTPMVRDWALTPHPNFKEGFFLKTKKVLALLVLTAMIMSIVPAMAFGALGAISIDNSRLTSTPDGSVPAVATVEILAAGNNEQDGQQFRVLLVDPTGEFDEDLYIGTSRPSVDRFFYSSAGKWYEVDYVKGSDGDPQLDKTSTDKVGVVGSIKGSRISNTSRELSIKVVSTAAGTSRIAFAINGTVGSSSPIPGYANAYDYAAGRTSSIQRQALAVDLGTWRSR